MEVLEDGLLLTDIEVTYRGKFLRLNRGLVDTDSGSTIIQTDLAESISIVAEENDIIYRMISIL